MDLSKKIGMRSFHLLNATQFLGALNDNVFKLLVVYLLINVKGQNEANTILALTPAPPRNHMQKTVQCLCQYYMVEKMF